MSKIKVNEIEAQSGSTITIPTGQSLVVTDGLATSSLPTVPVTKGGTGLTSLGTAGQILKVNSGATALEYGADQGGKIGQVISVVKTDTFSTTNTSSATDVTGLSVNITPTSTSSKVLVLISGNASSSSRTARIHLILGGTTSTAVGDAGTGSETTTTISPRGADDNYTQDPFSIVFLDSPASTSQQTYKLRMFGSGGTMYLNRPPTQDGNGGNTITTITVMEVLA